MMRLKVGRDVDNNTSGLMCWLVKCQVAAIDIQRILSNWIVKQTVWKTSVCKNFMENSYLIPKPARESCSLHQCFGIIKQTNQSMYKNNNTLIYD